MGQIFEKQQRPESPCPEDEVPAEHRLWIHCALNEVPDAAPSPDEADRVQRACALFKAEGYEKHINNNNTAITEFICYTHNRDMDQLWSRFKVEELPKYKPTRSLSRDGD